ncbi:hypothetical protein ECEPECA14_3365 [Escherichia coli EPECa14]|nr:hypothetical protein ECEPECA14_3365 [Escherichia coli EPECa14]
MKSIVDPSALVIDLGAQKRPTVISVVGAGGKTSLLFGWQNCSRLAAGVC